MRNIPTSGEFCDDCDFIYESESHAYCHMYFSRVIKWDRVAKQYRRDVTCLSDRPQVLTLEERAALHAKGYEDCMKDREEAKP